MTKERTSLATGAALIILGVGILALQSLGGFRDAVTQFLIGGLFLAAYLYTRAYGFLVPGGILLGLGLGTAGQIAGLRWGDLDAVGLGIGFVLIYAIALVYQGGSHWWPLIPGSVLILSGLAEGNTLFERLLSIGWPMILVLIGVLILASGFTRARRGSSSR